LGADDDLRAFTPLCSLHLQGSDTAVDGLFKDPCQCETPFIQTPQAIRIAHQQVFFVLLNNGSDAVTLLIVIRFKGNVDNMRSVEAVNAPVVAQKHHSVIILAECSHGIVHQSVFHGQRTICLCQHPQWDCHKQD
jgi:hypothetical protein